MNLRKDTCRKGGPENRGTAYTKGSFSKMKVTPLVLPSLDKEICGAKVSVPDFSLVIYWLPDDGDDLHLLKPPFVRHKAEAEVNCWYC
jgi:hypothetical protein